MENRKPMIPVSEKCKHVPVHVAGKLIYRTFIKIPDPGFTNIYKPKHNLDSVVSVTNPVTDLITDPVTGYVTIKHNPIVIARAKTDSDAESKKQLTTDQITAMALKHITLDSILVEYKHSNIVEQIAKYIIGLNSYNTFSADQQGLLCNKVMQIMSENDLPYTNKVVSTGLSTELSIVPVSVSKTSINSNIAGLRSTILASANKTVWVSLDSVAQALGISVESIARASEVCVSKITVDKYKFAVRTSLKEHNILIVDTGVATDSTTVIVKVTDISDSSGSIVTIKNIKDSLIAAGSKKALWFSYDCIAQGLGICIDSLTNVESDKIVQKYLYRNEVYIVYMGTTQTGDRTIRLGFTKPIKAKHKKQMLIEDDSEHKKMMAEVSAIKDAEMEARRKREDDEYLKAKHKK